MGSGRNVAPLRMWSCLMISVRFQCLCFIDTWRNYTRYHLQDQMRDEEHM
jgi:hypothetical protein